MGYPKAFYSPTKHESLAFSHQPPGMLVINRLLKSQAPWQKSSYSRVLKQKALVITDWTLGHLADEELLAIQLQLSKLIDEGFVLYLWQEGEIKKLTKETLVTINKLSIRNKVTPAFPRDVIEVAVNKHHLVQEQIHILDDYWLNLLVNPSQTNRRLSVTDLKETGHDISTILNLTQKIKPTISEINHDEFSTGHNELLLKVCDKFPEVNVLTHYKKLSIAGSQIKSLVEQGVITDEQFSLNLTQLQDIEELTIAGTYTVEAGTLQFLFANLPKLRKLKIDDYQGFSSNFAKGVSFDNLEILEVNGSNIAAADLREILAKAPKIKSLDLVKTPDLTPHKFAEGLEFRHLESLKADNNINTPDLLTIINQTKLLKRLELSSVNLPEDFSRGIDFNNLEVLALSDESEVEGSDILYILSQAKNLKSLNLSGEMNLPLNFTQDLSFEGLEVLELECKIKHADLWAILSQATGLTKLVLNTGKIPFYFTKGLSFDHLECLSIDATRLSISHEDLTSILSQAKRLKELHLSSFNFSDKFLIGLDFKNLEVLDLQFTQIKTDDLNEILTQAKKLRVLDLSDCKQIADSFDSLEPLENLEDLNLGHMAINATQLKKILLATPNLKRLTLEGCKGLAMDAELQKLIKDLLIFPDDFFEIKPRSPVNSQRSMQIDANTSNNSDKEYKIKQIFFPLDTTTTAPPVSSYRQAVYNDIYLNPNPNSLSDAFTLYNAYAPNPLPVFIPFITSEDELIDIGKKLVATKKDNENFYFGKQELVMSNEWQALTSLSAADLITHYTIEPEGSEIEIAYSTSDNLCYVRGKEGEEIKISFVLKTPVQSSTALPDFINTPVNFFNKNFQEGGLVLNNSTSYTGVDYLNSILNQKKGACRHRAVAFKSVMNAAHPDLPVRIIVNDCHAFAEVNIGNGWAKCDLGGYPAGLVVDETNDPLSSKIKSDASPLVDMEKDIDPEEAQYIKYLSTWEKVRSPFFLAPAYSKNIISGNGAKKHLIELEDSDDVVALHLSLEHYCQHSSRPVFYIHTPDDLSCSAPFISRQEDSNKGILTKGPGGPLYDFLQAHQKSLPPPVLIINYDNFDADDIVRFNGLLDTTRHADGTLLPEDTLVVGLINQNKPGCYQGEDFYSRFDVVERCRLPSEELTLHAALVASVPFIDSSEQVFEDKATIINLYHASDWKSRLLGRWELQGDNLYFVAGELEKALASGMPIELHNAPNSPDFKHFWRQAKLRGEILHEGHKIVIPPTLQLRMHEGYDWLKLLINVKEDEKLTANAEVLNPSRLSEFISQYDLEGTKLYSKPGWLSRYAEGELHVNLTRALNADEWGLFLTACQQYKIKLSVHRAPGVQGPITYLKENFKEDERDKNQQLSKEMLPKWEGKLNTKDSALVSTEPSTTLQMLLAPGGESYQIIDISECDSGDLLLHTEGRVDIDENRFVFKQTEHALLNALNQGQNVILKGKFSDHLIDALAPLLLSRQQNLRVGGRLILLSDTPCFPFLAMQEHQVNTNEKYTALAREFSKDELVKLDNSIYEQESFNQLKARLTYLRYHSEATSQAAWQGLEGLSGGIKLGDFDLANSLDIANAFNQKRLDEVNQVLSYSPYVFLTGLTAVGKSTFVEKNLNTANNKLYQSEANLLAWAIDKVPDKRKILFIDEANISQRQFSEFQGLFNNPPTILIDGVIHELTKDHKVVFAGNPLSYGDERHLAPLFAEHGRSVVFEPMPQEFIYEYILKPVFEKKLDLKLVEEISQTLLEVYRFLCECSTDSVLISPRELQMMALLTLLHLEKQKISNPLLATYIARHYAYQIAVGSVPEQFKDAFNADFRPHSSVLRQDKTTHHENFLITPSRLSVFEQFDDLLTLREYRQNKTINDAQRYGGLGGLVLEGEPGAGKSDLVIACLRARGYEEVHFNRDTNKALPEKPFYRMPVSMSLEEKKQLLNRAFDEGAVVVIDEINSSPMMERLLNDLLMGYNEKKQRPTRPGFLVIGTQNPVTMAGRRAPSTALARRLIKTDLQAYSNEEMQAILIDKGLGETDAAKLVRAYEIDVKKAAKEHLTPAPTFRDLLRLADNVFKASKKHERTEDDQKDEMFEENIASDVRDNKRRKMGKSDSNVKHRIFSLVNSENYQPSLFKDFSTAETNHLPNPVSYNKKS